MDRGGFVVGDRVKTAGYGHIGTVVDFDDDTRSVLALFDVDKTDPWPCPVHMLTKLSIIDRLAELPNEADLAN